METQMMLLLGSLLCALVGGFLVSLALQERIVKVLRNQKVQNRSGVDGSLFASLLRHGIPFLLKLSRKLLLISPIKRYGETVQRALRSKYGSIPVETIISLLVAATVVVSCFGVLLSSSMVCGIALGVCLWLSIGLWAGHRCDLEREQLREAIPEALQSMKACFQVGYTLMQTISELRHSLSGPLGELFHEVEGVLKTGGNPEDALAVLKNKTDEPELVFLATALEIQHKTGSSMQQVLEITRQSVSDEIELKRTLKTQTAQAKLSAQIVTIMPFALIGIFSLVSPGFLDPFFESMLGICLLLVALGMQLLGISLVRRLLKVEVA